MIDVDAFAIQLRANAGRVSKHRCAKYIRLALVAGGANGNRAGHIQGFDGKNWISDFIQNGFWPGQVYRQEKADYAYYRP